MLDCHLQNTVKMSTHSTAKDSPTEPSVTSSLPSEQIERLDSVIIKLKDKVNSAESGDDSEEATDPETIRRGSISSRQMIADRNASNSPTKTNKYRTFDTRENFLTLSYLMWENNSNICWLDASMSLLVHNRSLRRLLDDDSSSQVAEIIEKYDEAILLLNDFSNPNNIDVRMLEAKGMLKEIQESSLKYLQPRLKYKDGEPDSAFCSLYNLISESKLVRNFFELDFTSVLECQKCNNHRTREHTKPIITLSKVKAFQPTSPISVCQCPVCKKPEQYLVLNYKTLPQCLIFHFESGAGKGELQSLDFTLNERRYRLTGVMVMEKSRDSNLNHFVTWIRDPDTDSWLECNDLNSDILSFSVVPPFIDLEEVYIVMYEASDTKGTIFSSPLTVSAEEKGDSEEVVGKSNANIPLIDLSDDETGSTVNIADKSKSSGCSVQKVELVESCESYNNSDKKAPLTEDSEVNVKDSEKVGEKDSAEDEMEDHALSNKTEGSYPSVDIGISIQIENDIRMPLEHTTIPSTSKRDETIAEQKLVKNSFSGIPTTPKDHHLNGSSKSPKAEFAADSSENITVFKIQSCVEKIQSISGDIEIKSKAVAEQEGAASSELSDENFVNENTSSPFLHSENLTFGSLDITVTKLTEKSKTRMEKIKRLISGNLNKSKAVPKQEVTSNQLSNANFVTKGTNSQILSEGNVTVEYPDITITRLTERSSKQTPVPGLYQIDLPVLSYKDCHYSKVSPIANQNKNIIGSTADTSCIPESKTDGHNKKATETQKFENKEKIEKLQESSDLLLNSSENKLTDEFKENWGDESGSLPKNVTVNSPNTILPAHSSNIIPKNTVEVSNIHSRNNFELLAAGNTMEPNNKTLTVPKSQNASKAVTITRRSSRKRKFTPKLVENLRRNELNSSKIFNLNSAAIPEVSENTESANVDTSKNNSLLTFVGHQKEGVERIFQKENPPLQSIKTPPQEINVVSHIQPASVSSTNQVKCFYASGPAQICPGKILLHDKDRNNLEDEIKPTFTQQIETMADIKGTTKEEYLDLTLSQYKKRLQSHSIQLENPKSLTALLDIKCETKNPNSRFLQTKSSAELPEKEVKKHQKTKLRAYSTANQTLQEKLTSNKSVKDDPTSNEAEESVKASQQTVGIPMKNSIINSSESTSSLNLKSKLTESEKESTCKMVSSSKVVSKETEQLYNGETKCLGKTESARIKYQVKDVRVALKKLDEETLMAELSGNARKKDEIETRNCEQNDSGKKLLSNGTVEPQNTKEELDSVHILILPENGRVVSRKDVSDELNSVPEKHPLGNMKIMPSKVSTKSSSEVKTKNIYNSVLESNPGDSFESMQSTNVTSQTDGTKSLKNSPKRSANILLPNQDENPKPGSSQRVNQRRGKRKNQSTNVTGQTNGTKSLKNSPKQIDILLPNQDENSKPGSPQNVNQQRGKRNNQSAIAAIISSAAKKIAAPCSSSGLKSSVRKYSRIQCLPAMNVNATLSPEQQKTILQALKISKQSVCVLPQETKIPEMTELFQADMTIPDKPHSTEPPIGKCISPKSESSLKSEAREIPPVGGRSKAVDGLLSQANSQFGVSVIVDANLDSENTNLNAESIVTWAPNQTTLEICGKSFTESPKAKPNEGHFPSRKKPNCKQTPNGGFTYSSETESIHASTKENLESISVTDANNKNLKASLFQETNAISHKKVRFSNGCSDEITVRPSETLAEVEANHDVAISVDDTKSKEIEDYFTTNVHSPMKKTKYSKNVPKQEVSDLIHLIQSNADHFSSKTLDLKSEHGGVSSVCQISPKKKRNVEPTAIASKRKKHKANKASNVSSESNLNVNVHLPCSNSSSRSSLHISQTCTQSAESVYCDTDSSGNCVKRSAKSKTRKVKAKTHKESSKPQSCKPNCDCGSLDQVEIVQGMCELFYKELYTYFKFGSK